MADDHVICAICGGWIVRGVEGWDHRTRLGHRAHYATPVPYPTWRHADGKVRVDHMDARPGDYFGLPLNDGCPPGEKLEP